jgi:hypothetical protein
MSLKESKMTTKETVSVAKMAMPVQIKQLDWRRLVFSGVAALAALLLLAFGSLHGLVAIWARDWVASEPGIQHPEIHLWHDAQIGALVGIMLVGSLLALVWKPRQQPLVAQFLALGSLLYLAVLIPFDPAAALVLGILLAIPLACYPTLRNLVNFRRTAQFSQSLLGLTLLASALMIPPAWQWLQLQLLDTGEHALANHWITGVALVGVLSLAGFLAATRRPGWHVLGVLVGLALLHQGAAALTLPDQPGSWGQNGGVIVLIGGLLFIGLTIFEMRRPVSNLSE